MSDLVVVLAVAALVPLLLAAAPRLPLPGPVLEIVAGIVLGPHVLDVVRADATVTTLSTIGLAFLLFLAGLEIDVEHLRGQRARLAATSLALSLAAAAVVGAVLGSTGVVESGLLVGVVLVATSLGLVIPVLRDAGAGDSLVGQLVIAGASSGEVAAVVLLSLLFSERDSGLAVRLLLLGLLALLAALVVVGTMRAERLARLAAVVDRLADTSAQVRVRLAVLLVVGTGAVAERLGFEAILGAFLAGGVLRLADPRAVVTHPQFHVKLDGLGFGFLVPVFFVTSGVQFPLDVLRSSPAQLLRIPLFLAALVVVRGLPALAYRRVLPAREVVAAGLLQATSLPFLVAATTIGVRVGAVRPGGAAALVGAGLLSVVLFPAVAVRLLRSPAAGEPAREAAPPAAEDVLRRSRPDR